eukprot:CAMPEP_0113899670 /NCGR_PEP_ID=MMETSP0780_2-20120614/20185_1 /TAXON_ID=652834 /ORGANISM="Palpitomonas bilix" /LENGTH=369 /DNA_ID=CAMNT_0000891913 /DNA_START=29 /DNA_END=1138 /DNA_ORIENTATION=+ /assembly_acc=CAM_ASM_000599
MGEVPDVARDAVLVPSENQDVSDKDPVEGYDFNLGIDHHALLKKYLTTGFQATHFGRAVQEVHKMLQWRLSDDPNDEDPSSEYHNEETRKKTRTRVFLSFTSNMISSGVREVIRFLVQHKFVDVITTTGGAIEEDLIKCLAPTVVGDFALKGADLRKKGLNRIGNLLIPNDNYVKFEDWMGPILDEMLKEQKEQGMHWTPSKIINRLGKEINDERSVWYWAYKNDIPVYCPAITDGSIGDMIYFHSFKSPGLVVDLVQDIRGINNAAVCAKKTGMLIVGGGVVKHHTCNANLMRNGADYAVFINTAEEYDGSDSGAKPDEAVSWGKIRGSANSVKIHGEATLIFPLLVAETFARYFDAKTGQKLERPIE